MATVELKKRSETCHNVIVDGKIAAQAYSNGNICLVRNVSEQVQAEIAELVEKKHVVKKTTPAPRIPKDLL